MYQVGSIIKSRRGIPIPVKYSNIANILLDDDMKKKTCKIKHNSTYFSCSVLSLKVMFIDYTLWGKAMKTCPGVTEGQNKGRKSEVKTK